MEHAYISYHSLMDIIADLLLLEFIIPNLVSTVSNEYILVSQCCIVNLPLQVCARS